jgi:hypothetical protein
VPERSHYGGRLLLQALFPHLEAVYGNRYYGNEQVLKWTRQKRICSPSHFSRYFAYGLPVGDILDADVQKVIDSDESESANWLRLLLHDDNDAGLVVQKLLEHASGLDAAASARLASAIAEVGAELPVSDGPIQPESPTIRAGYVISLLLRNVDAVQRASVASKVLDRADLAFATVVFSWIESASGLDGPGEPLLSVDALERAGSALASDFVSMTPDELMSPGRIRMVPTICRVCRRYGQLETMIEKLVAVMDRDPGKLRDFLAMFLVPIPGPPVNVVGRNGYDQLNAVIPGWRILSLVRDHFPGIAETAEAYSQATPGSPEQQQFIASPDAPMVMFMALYSAIDNVRPVTPSTVFDPSTQRPAGLMNLDRGSFPQHGAEVRPILVIRATVIRPEDASAAASVGLSVASQVDDQARERLLSEIVASTNLGHTLNTIREYWGTSELSDWTFAGTNSGDVSNLFMQSVVEEGKPPDISAHLSLSTGWYGRGVDQIPSPGIFGWIEILFRKRAEFKHFDVSQLRDLLVDSMGVIDVTYKAANSFLVSGPYETGEVALWVGTSASGLDAVVDMEPFPVLPGNPPRNEIQVFSTLPLEEPVYNPLLAAYNQASDSKKRLAVELVTRSIQWSGRRDYAPTMHQLLRSND